MDDNHAKRASNALSLHSSANQSIIFFMATPLKAKRRTKSASRTAAKKGVRRKKKNLARRTTVSLSPGAAQIVIQFVAAANISLSQAVSNLIERTEPAPSRLKNVNGFLVLSDPPKAKKALVSLTVEDIKRMDDRTDREYLGRFGAPRENTRRNRNPRLPK
jgi:hypothetical protein